MKQFDPTVIFRRYHSDSEIYHDLMRERVREILLVATLYDAFILQQEGRLSEKIYDDYFMLSLSNAPRITHAASSREAMDLLKRKKFDVVVIMLRIDEINPIPLAEQIRSLCPDIPTVILLNDNSEIPVLFKWESQLDLFTDIFVWNGDSKVFLAMVKHIEDLMNVDTDTRLGLVHVILLVEDSIRYYSRYLPILYTQVIQQTQHLMSEENFDDRSMMLRLRSRPKILTARTYDKAVEIIDKHKDYLLCVISDMSYPRNGIRNPRAGFELATHVRNLLPNLPVMIQSSDEENAFLAARVNAGFIHKNSPTLAEDITRFMQTHLGFGPFIFRMPDGRFVAKASTLADMAQIVESVPEASLTYHGRLNHYSAWLMARGEIQMARRIQPISIADFKTPGELRSFLSDVFKRVHIDKHRGTIVSFDKKVLGNEHLILRLSDGSMGGKGRGLAFINALIHGDKIPQQVDSVCIRIPHTAIIGGHSYGQFINNRPFRDTHAHRLNFSIQRRAALNTPLPEDLVEHLREYLAHITVPLAIRSSGILEDSISYPFSGVYPTYLLSNNHPDLETRLHQVMDAIRLIYVSVFSPGAQGYFESISFPFEEERMAVVIQELVGRRHGDHFYPDISGVAQSFNYYPFGRMKPEDGLATIAVGLGKHVCEGGKSHRFCPRMPKLDIDKIDQRLEGSQKRFWALNMARADFRDMYDEEATLDQLDMDIAEKDGVLNDLVSVWDIQNQRLEPGLIMAGPRIVDFAQILKYDLFPLGQTITAILNAFTHAMGSPVEVEFAVDMTDRMNPIFFILQIKHMIRQDVDFSLDIRGLNRSELLLATDRGLGNGQIEDIRDVIFADMAVFDRSRTVEMTNELEYFNKKLRAEGRRYILIGPGRWGTHDRWLGIPVRWAQISGAGAIVEIDMDDIHVDASQGSHFFHNITSMKIGYFTVHRDEKAQYLDMDWLKTRTEVERMECFVHVQTASPFLIQMDGRNGVCIIRKPSI
ncbi:hypothetical protein JXA80_10540 [bacterium]|nr:hypothetical protein [candidate division CSSED10-310 bacterium]